MDLLYAAIGVILAIVLSGIGSAFGVAIASTAAAGVITEDPDKFGKTMLLQLLPATQGIYGFIVGFLLFITKITAGGIAEGSGAIYLGLCIPVAVVGLVSAILQGKVAAVSIIMVGKRGELSGRGMTMTVFVEMFALLAFIISILGVMLYQG
ncbi:MAG: V-type ATP synthase subunit K [Clostridiales bacterium]|jgi:V/A-type H+-transporting ATPase subunit K|nr:V-type ATP synthase subunit K [Clostridiales bacterium]